MNDVLKKGVMKKLLERKGKGGPGSGGAGQYAIDDPTKAVANIDNGGVPNPFKATPQENLTIEDRSPSGKGGPGYSPFNMIGDGAKNVASAMGNLGRGLIKAVSPAISNSTYDKNRDDNFRKEYDPKGMTKDGPSKMGNLGKAVKGANSPSRFPSLGGKAAPVSPQNVKKDVIKKAVGGNKSGPTPVKKTPTVIKPRFS